MLDDPGKTSRLLAALKAALPFEVHLTPPLALLLRERQVVLPAGGRQTVSGVSYLGDEGGIVCHIVPPDGREVAFVPLTHVRVPPPMPLAAEVLRYRKRRVKKLRQHACTGDAAVPGHAGAGTGAVARRAEVLELLAGERCRWCEAAGGRSEPRVTRAGGGRDSGRAAVPATCLATPSPEITDRPRCRRPSPAPAQAGGERRQYPEQAPQQPADRALLVEVDHAQ